MKKNYSEMPNGYLETIQNGIKGLRAFRSGLTAGTGTSQENITRLKEEIKSADAVVIGAGAGLSTAAGYIYTGERFRKYFSDFIEKYGMTDMYSGGFYPFETAEEFWGFWSRYIWINRYAPMPTELYDKLRKVTEGKEYFVITTNVDHCFQRAGFDKKHLFYTQGDYGLFQSSHPHGAAACKTYENEEIIRQMVLSQGFEITDDGTLLIPEETKLKMTIPSSLLPYCPEDGEPMTTNLRADDRFVEDEGWHKASAAYAEFLKAHKWQHVLYLEIGVGSNTPVIIKYPFWQMTAENNNAVYACLNYGEACCPKEIEERSVCIDGDCGEIIEQLL